MSAGETLALYDDAVAVGSGLCNDFLEAVRGSELAGSANGHLGVIVSWAFEAGGQSVTITKRGTSHDAQRIQSSLADSGGTQIQVTGEDIPGMDQIFDTRTIPASLVHPNISVSRPSDFSELIQGNARVGNGSLTLGEILERSVKLDPHKLGLFLNGMIPDLTSASKRLAHFGDTAEGLGEFSATAILRRAVLEDRRRVVSREFSLQLLSKPDILVFETFHPTITTNGEEEGGEGSVLSIRGSRYGVAADGTRRKPTTEHRIAGLIPQTVEELGEIEEIGHGVISYIAGYARGYANRFKDDELDDHSDELFAMGYAAGRRLALPVPGPARFTLRIPGAQASKAARL